MDKQDGAIVLSLLVIIFQFILGYVLTVINPLTPGGQEVAGLALALDAVSLAAIFSIYNRFFARTVYSEKED
ncbi:MAG: hypothetical protein QW767_06750 [Thermoprotei archaeon]